MNTNKNRKPFLPPDQAEFWQMPRMPGHKIVTPLPRPMVQHKESILRKGCGVALGILIALGVLVILAIAAAIIIIPLASEPVNPAPAPAQNTEAP